MIAETSWIRTACNRLDGGHDTSTRSNPIIGRIRSAICICVLPLVLLFSHDKLAYALYAALLSVTQRASLLGQEPHAFLREEACRRVFQTPGSNWTRKILTLKASLSLGEEDQKGMK